MGCTQQKISNKKDLKNGDTNNLSTLPMITGNKTIKYQINYYQKRLSLKSIDQSTILRRRRTKEQITEQSSPTKYDK
ncbi:unnamed protein product [Paramecium sonneborni]|uniref:Uncharacterized protein n=1 Tax=Paramecium sonneborni TaxID=65129 RepID=A0A8S1NGC2_9CILI|nr:unnamed protein product [Paramecium sonneborni]